MKNRSIPTDDTRPENSFIKTQCKTMTLSVQTFEQACQLAALEDDGKISKEEAKALKKIRSAAAAFRAALEQI